MSANGKSAGRAWRQIGLRQRGCSAIKKVLGRLLVWVPSEVPGKQGATIRIAIESDGVPFWVHVFFSLSQIYWDTSALRKPTGYAICRSKSIVFVNFFLKNAEVSRSSDRGSAVEVLASGKAAF